MLITAYVRPDGSTRYWNTSEQGLVGTQVYDWAVVTARRSALIIVDSILATEEEGWNYGNSLTEILVSEK